MYLVLIVTAEAKPEEHRKAARVEQNRLTALKMERPSLVDPNSAGQ